ncbi:SH3 domain-containing protein [Ancylobacter lacus]|uniref:SH3 domain-containing protein n=1 Tax=Ancylobacter lacus TaxID=2579970 RepID=UPI001BCFC4B1|nr:SH3 domain-containing protein [Ancylobacter lacus]MBS7538506.1 SH3 domain-containing protein [Ancylobacter lacus]
MMRAVWISPRSAAALTFATAPLPGDGAASLPAAARHPAPARSPAIVPPAATPPALLARSALLGLALLGGAAPALAQSLPAEPALRPYKPVTVTYDLKGADDPGLVALVASLRAAVAARLAGPIRDAAAPDLAVLMPPLGFPSTEAPRTLDMPAGLDGSQKLDHLFTRLSTDEKPDRKALDLLILATAGEALAHGTLSRSSLGRDTFCAPAEPRFDRGRVLAVAKAANEVPENLVVLTRDVGFRETPDPAAPVVATVKADTVVPVVEGAAEGKDGHRDWYAVALPNGKRGYARGNDSISFETTRLCFARAGQGEPAGWKLTLIVMPMP